MSVSDLEKSIDFYRRAFGADILAKGEKLAYFDLNGIWIALNVEIGINRNYAADSYTHIAFGLSESELIKFVNRLDIYSIDYSKGRSRSEHEGSSVYLRDPDGHLLEVHTKLRIDRLSYYDREKDDIEVYGII